MMNEEDEDDSLQPDEDTPGIPLHMDSLPRGESVLVEQFTRVLQSNEFHRRRAELPELLVEMGPHVELLEEARQVFIFGYWYACVAICGIAAERIIKDLLRKTVKVDADGKVATPSDKAFDQLERVDVRGLVQFLRETGVLSALCLKAANELGELRNQYAHARGKNPEADAQKAIRLLHVIVEETVNVRLD